MRNSVHREVLVEGHDARRLATRGDLRVLDEEDGLDDGQLPVATPSRVPVTEQDLELVERLGDQRRLVGAHLRLGRRHPAVEICIGLAALQVAGDVEATRAQPRGHALAAVLVIEDEDDLRSVQGDQLAHREVHDGAERAAFDVRDVGTRKTGQDQRVAEPARPAGVVHVDLNALADQVRLHEVEHAAEALRRVDRGLGALDAQALGAVTHIVIVSVTVSVRGRVAHGSPLGGAGGGNAA